MIIKGNFQQLVTMCDFKTLHLDKNLGYVLQCIDCGNITIGFKIITFSRTLPEFYRMVKDVHDCHAYHSNLGADPQTRSIPFWQLSECSCMTMSLNELHELGVLLDLAHARIMLEKLFLNLPDN